ncbi:pyrazinamidase/nicotinamidase [Annulohypoxylon maeteangense]|uniref:pyrazinamidase/nicotinamidase n=1 Tax=Annulohypoxylon maeteangense TaxID=1927788 RepID=UPI002008A740|nr:pyrazinamidase/nicotinamidase [Annulohypoxylon maeteangense]KAI0879819.1 pyrazinamidase/nicotinamidase [Annulohypoxylon maeteangense]
MPDFRPALLIVDLQEDFCPPNGSLAVANGRDIAPLINKLLELPFVAKIATKDWHPIDHVSFAANHEGKSPFRDFIKIENPHNRSETYESRLWPVHCVQGTPGAELIHELSASHLDTVLEKGTDSRVEMYSPFYDPFVSPRVYDSGLAKALSEKRVTDLYVVGLAADYCVKNAALDAAKEGFKTYLVEECTRPVDVSAWPGCREEIKASGVKIVSMDGPEVRRLMTAQ